MKKEHSEKFLQEKIKTYLSFRSHSEHELKLKLKNFDKQAVEKALNQARENKWLLDPKELAQRVAEELHRKKRGWLLIQSALKKKKLPEVLKQEDLEEEKCLYWLTKKSSPKKSSSPDFLRKMYRFLIYRGFENQTAKKAIYKYFHQRVF